ncbi:MAG: rRNA adenine N-6-methyltransferase family protein, partial [Planctomycetota bacterium]|nr:rRNA adenine N-6-methyltransferase family protein [Planctomycetota bacterium]
GPASLLVGYWARPQYLKKIAPGSFWPPPRVDSAVIRLEPRYEVVTDDIKKDYASFSEWVRILFQKRRKQLGGSLRSIIGQDQADKALTLCELDATVRPENLSLEHFRLLAKGFPFNNG